MLVLSIFIWIELMLAECLAVRDKERISSEERRGINPWTYVSRVRMFPCQRSYYAFHKI